MLKNKNPKLREFDMNHQCLKRILFPVNYNCSFFLKLETRFLYLH